MSRRLTKYLGECWHKIEYMKKGKEMKNDGNDSRT
jgi:hypothetical protein